MRASPLLYALGVGLAVYALHLMLLGLFASNAEQAGVIHFIAPLTSLMAGLFAFALRSGLMDHVTSQFLREWNQLVTKEE
jgi:hypothetical protein